MLFRKEELPMFESKNNENKKITIYDIAEEAGVSISTVSRVLTGSAGVRATNREKVQQLIDKYNFRPNALARGLSETKRKVIGIIVPDIRNSFYADLYMACDQTAHNMGYSLFLENSLSRLETELSQLELMEEQRVDAIILVGGRVDDLYSNREYVEKVNQISNTTPIIVVGKLDGTACHQIRIDAIKSMDLVMEHLFMLGHQDIAIIGGYDEIAASFEKRQRYKQLLHKNQIVYCKEFCENYGGYDFPTGYRKMNELFDSGHIPTAVIAINDTTALGIMQSIQEHGLRIPDDISVISYDNTSICNMIHPKLSSVDYNYEIFAEKIISTTISLCEHQEMPMLQLITPSLVVRASTGFCNKKKI